MRANNLCHSIAGSNELCKNLSAFPEISSQADQWLNLAVERRCTSGYVLSVYVNALTLLSRPYEIPTLLANGAVQLFSSFDGIIQNLEIRPFTRTPEFFSFYDSGMLLSLRIDKPPCNAQE